MPMPRSSVMVLSYSYPYELLCAVGVGVSEIVGSDTSSLTPGSSMVRVVGNTRSPQTTCACAAGDIVMMNSENASAATSAAKRRDMGNLRLRASVLGRAYARCRVAIGGGRAKRRRARRIRRGVAATCQRRRHEGVLEEKAVRVTDKTARATAPMTARAIHATA